MKEFLMRLVIFEMIANKNLTTLYLLLNFAKSPCGK